MAKDSRFDSIVEKIEIWTVITSLVVLFLVYFGRSRPPEVKVEESLKGKASPTLDNLQKAYSSEANSHLMYLNFAKKAREEGYKDVALLFKILADAEEIHRDNHARVIKAMGATPTKATIAPQTERKADLTTSNLDELLKDNLSSSVNGESNERQMYIQFVKQAKLDNNLAALKTFETALVAEYKHSNILAQVKGNLDSWKLRDHQFYVCQLTGEIFDSHPGLEACLPK